MAEDVKDSVDDFDLSDFNFDDLPEVDADIDLNLDEANSADLNFDDILEKENKSDTESAPEHKDDTLSFDDLGNDGISEKGSAEVSEYTPVADEDVFPVDDKVSEIDEENILEEDILSAEEKTQETSSLDADDAKEDIKADDFTPRPFGATMEEVAEDDVLGDDASSEEEKELETSSFSEDMVVGDVASDNFTSEPLGTTDPEITEDNVLADDILPAEEKVPEVAPFGEDMVVDTSEPDDFTPEPFGADENEIAEEDILAEKELSVEDKNNGEVDEETDTAFYEDEVKDAEPNRPLDDFVSETQILEPNNIAYLRWISGNENDQMYEIGKNFKSNTFEANDNCKTIHVNVGYDTYGWEVQFADGVIMNLRDVREYQVRNGKLPSSEGRIIYGPNTLMFSGVERIVIYETVRYFSYGI